MNKSWLALLLTLGLLSASCNNNDCENGFSEDCDFFFEPAFGPLSVLVTIDEENPFVPIVVYDGWVEDSVVYIVDTLTNDIRYEVDIDRRYSAVATYRNQGRTILAVDGDRVSSRRTFDCDVECWEVNSGTVNLRLKK